MSLNLNKKCSKRFRKTLYICVGVVSFLMLYLVMHVEYFEDEDRLGLVKGVKLSPFYEHIEVYSYGDSKFPFTIDVIKLTKTPFATITYCQNDENESIVKYDPFAERFFVKIYNINDGNLISSEEVDGVLFRSSNYYTPLLHSGNITYNIRLYTDFGNYDIYG